MTWSGLVDASYTTTGEKEVRMKNKQTNKQKKKKKKKPKQKKQSF